MEGGRVEKVQGTSDEGKGNKKRKRKLVLQRKPAPRML